MTRNDKLKELCKEKSNAYLILRYQTVNNDALSGYYQGQSDAYAWLFTVLDGLKDLDCELEAIKDWERRLNNASKQKNNGSEN